MCRRHRNVRWGAPAAATRNVRGSAEKVTGVKKAKAVVKYHVEERQQAVEMTKQPQTVHNTTETNGQATSRISQLQQGKKLNAAWERTS